MSPTESFLIENKTIAKLLLRIGEQFGKIFHRLHRDYGNQIADRYHFARRLAAEACHAAPAAPGAGNPPNWGAVKEINNI
jgi:hypothetical protein